MFENVEGVRHGMARQEEPEDVFPREYEVGSQNWNQSREWKRGERDCIISSWIPFDLLLCFTLFLRRNRFLLSSSIFSFENKGKKKKTSATIDLFLCPQVTEQSSWVSCVLLFSMKGRNGRR